MHYPENVANSFAVSTFPNPLQNDNYIIVQAKENQLLDVTATDATGRLMWYTTYRISAGNNYFTIPTGTWARGIYFFRFVNDKGEKETRKIMKQ